MCSCGVQNFVLLIVHNLRDVKLDVSVPLAAIYLIFKHLFALDCCF